MNKNARNPSQTALALFGFLMVAFACQQIQKKGAQQKQRIHTRNDEKDKDEEKLGNYFSSSTDTTLRRQLSFDSRMGAGTPREGRPLSMKQEREVKIKRERGKTFLEQQAEIRTAAEGGSSDGRKLDNAYLEDILIHDVTSLRGTFPSHDVNHTTGQQYNKVLDIHGQEDYVMVDIVRKARKKQGGDKISSSFKEGKKDHSCNAFVRAGPRSRTHFDPSRVRAAIVTCGGLCPGLNNVIRELTHALIKLYNAEMVLGIRGGYHGFNEASGFDPFELTLENVESCHHQGGTILASSRGGFDLNTIIRFLKDNSIDQLYVIGGDGTHRGANIIAEECIALSMNVAVVGIPKTIDNDVDLIDRSFGFTTSVEAAQAAIRSAKTEAMCNLPNGIGIVKLMGRSAGFIAVHATLASGDVDLCLVPEISIELEGEKGCMPFLMKRVKQNGHAVVVVAEGAGEELLGKSAQTDASGNKVLPAIGEFLKKEIVRYFKEHEMEATVKYIDPSYMIRSIPANASDSLYCMLLASNAVHGCMAGYTAFSVGLVNNRVVYIPISKLVATSPRVMDPVGRTWERVLSATLQPNGKPTVGINSHAEGLLLI